MTVPAASSSLSRSMEALVLTLADSATFRTLVGAIDAAGAKAHIYYPAVDDVLDGSGNLVNARPRALINPPTDWKLERMGRADYGCTGNLWMHFEFPRVGSGFSEELMNFCNTCGQIIDEIWVLAESRTAPYLNITGIHLADGPAPNNPENDRGETFYGSSWMVEWQ